jgi:hypothetical protein
MDLFFDLTGVPLNQLFFFVINLFFSIFVFITFLRLKRHLKKYRFLLKGNEEQDLETLLLNLGQKLNDHSIKLTKVITEFETFCEHSRKYLQNWALIRFKAFDNIGGDQSFALALMDSFGDGLVFSSIFGREESVVYCKPIKGGVSSYPLSKEEQEAINQALKQKT